MDEVLMRHPELGVERLFPASAVGMHRASGWVPVDTVEETEEQPVAMSAEEAMALGRSLPAKSAPKADWERAARDAGVPDTEIAAATKDDLIDRLTGTQE